MFNLIYQKLLFSIIYPIFLYEDSHVENKT